MASASGSLAREKFDHPALSSATLFILSCSVLILEVALTRVFSFVLWYHLTYLVVGLALLGYGAAGTDLAMQSDLQAANYTRCIARNCAGFALGTIVASTTAVWLPRSAEQIFEGNYLQIIEVVLTHLILALPFFFAGKCIGFVLLRNRHHTNRLYSADLFGAGAGAFLAVVLINHLGAVSAIYFAAALPGCVVLAAVWKEAFRHRVLAGGLIVMMATGAVVSIRHPLIPLSPEPTKDMAGREGHIAFTDWNILNRIDLMTPSQDRFDFGGRISESYTGQWPLVRVIYQDATAPTALVHVDGKVKDFGVLGYFLQGAPYAIRNNPDSVLILGFGGGIDGLIAEHAGAAHIVGVDINPITVDLVSRRYRDFSSAVFEGGHVNLVVSEGRNYLTRTAAKFDVIQLSGVDTFAALSAGAFALSENYLYTAEAVNDLLSHLNDDGVLSYSRWLFTPPRETLKLVVTIGEGLRQIGVQDPRSHIVIVAGGPPSGRWADTMVKKTPFTAQEISDLKSWARARQFDLVYDPLEPKPSFFQTYLSGSDREQGAFINSYLYDVSPSRDDRPFFFQFYRWKSIWNPAAVRGIGGYSSATMPKGLLSLILALAEMLMFSLLFVLMPLATKRTFGLPIGKSVWWMTAFAGLGLGFISIEMVLMQKLSVFLGGPAYSMSITLFALLVFSGLGSRASQRLSRGTYRAIVWMFAGLLAVQGLELMFLDWGVPHFLGLPHIWRCIAAVTAIAPMGLLMGMPFPTLLAKAGVDSPPLVPWAWGVNACATVVGSVLATIANMALGFNLTWLLAMCTYAIVVAVIALTRWLPEMSQSPEWSRSSEEIPVLVRSSFASPQEQ
jgi:spermine/spermidine synthase